MTLEEAEQEADIAFYKDNVKEHQRDNDIASFESSNSFQHEEEYIQYLDSWNCEPLPQALLGLRSRLYIYIHLTSYISR